MRLWSIHPKYLDVKGLVALWREGLLAKKAIISKTRYFNHPQLTRFKNTKNPVLKINTYLYYVLEEALKRGYNFNRSKLDSKVSKEKIPVTKGQLNYEFKHLKKKLKSRCLYKAKELKNVKRIKTHPIFYLVKGNVECWEKSKSFSKK